MGIDDWSTDESQNLELDGSDISRRASPGAPANELTRKLMAHVKELEEKIVSDGIAVDGITIENNSGTLTVKDVAIDGDTTDLLTAKIEEIEAAATQAGQDATAAQTAATQAATSAASVETSVTAAATAANTAAEQADIAARAAARAQSGAAMAESAVQAVISGTNFNWQKSEKAGAVAVYSVPETALEPTVDFMFTETGPASGDKAPDNPSTITGVSSVKVTRCGKNIIKYPFYQTTRTVNGVTWTDNGDGTVTANGTASETSSFHLVNPYWNPNGGILLLPGTYHLSGCPAGGYWNTYNLRVITSANNTDSGYVTAPSDTGSGGNIVVTKASIVSCSLNVTSGTTVSNLVFKPQLELGTTATAFEPYEGADYTVNLGSTYYGGSIDLATGLMTVTWAHQVVTGGATTLTTIDASTLQFRFSITSGNHIASDTTNLACNRFVPGSTLLVTSYESQLYYARIAKTLLDVSGAVDPSNPTDAEWLAAINSWLSSNNIEIAYKLAAPFTVQLTPTQILSLAQTDKYTPRLNTIYTDAQAVQVGYAKSPIRSEYELTQAIIATEGGE